MKRFGLDFGTTNSSIAIEEKGLGKVLEIDLAAVDQRVIRSMLFFNRREIVYDPKIPRARIENQVLLAGDFHYEGEFHPLIGQEAVNTYLGENKSRKAGIRRRIYTGRVVNMITMEETSPGPDAIREYYEEIDYGTGRLLQALKTALKSPYYRGTTIFGQHFSLEEMISVFIKEVKKKAEEVLGEKIDEVVCGRPVHFLDDPAKDKTAQDRLEKALKLSGFKKIKFQFEPVAAARQFLASEKSDKTVFVFDFGGGTLDTAIVKPSGEVLAEDGVYIGGDLLNSDILEHKLWKYFGSGSYYGDVGIEVPVHIYEGLKSWYSIPNLNNPEMMNLLERCKYRNKDAEAIDRLIYLIKTNLGFELYEAIEKAKKTLSLDSESVISFSDGPIDINEKITREEFENIIKKRVEEIEQVIHKTLNKAGIGARDIDLVVRTGGSSLIPVFEKLLEKIFGREKIKQFETFTSIAAGLALES